MNRAEQKTEVLPDPETLSQSPTMKPVLIFFSLILVSGKTGYAMSAPPIYPAILVFGDSSDLLASSFGIKEFVPPYLDPSLSDFELQTGVSFASAGSGLDELTTQSSRGIPVSVQVGYFKRYKEVLVNAVGKEEANKIISRALVMIAAGANDIVFNFYDTPARRSQFNITGYHDFLLQKQESLVKELYGLGCRSFAVSGLAPLGCIPFQISVKNPEGRKCLEDENAETQMYNSKLENLTRILPASLLGSSITYLDNYNPVMDMINNPHKYGFVETNKGCCGTGLTESGTLCNASTPVCSNPSEYLFWDAIHPSEAAYRIVHRGRLIHQQHCCGKTFTPT